jgi:hypothetical protein
VVQRDYDSKAKWRAYGFVQDTVETTATARRTAAPGHRRRLPRQRPLQGRAPRSRGDLGAAAKLGTEYLYSDRTNLYLNYALENERTDNGMRARAATWSPASRRAVRHHQRLRRGALQPRRRADRPDARHRRRPGAERSLELGASWTRHAAGQRRPAPRRAHGRRPRSATASTRSSFERLRVPLRQHRAARPVSVSERTTWLFKNSLKYQLNPDWRLLGKLNHSESESSLGEFYDGGYTEAVLGYAYRPVKNDRLNTLAKYTYFYNVPTTGQVSAAPRPSSSRRATSLAGRRLRPDAALVDRRQVRLPPGQVSLDREDPEFFDNRAPLHRARRLALPRLGGRSWKAACSTCPTSTTGAAARCWGSTGTRQHLKVGAGYNFTDFSDDLTDLSYDHQGPIFWTAGGTSTRRGRRRTRRALP